MPTSGTQSSIQPKKRGVSTTTESLSSASSTASKHPRISNKDSTKHASVNKSSDTNKTPPPSLMSISTYIPMNPPPTTIGNGMPPTSLMNGIPPTSVMSRMPPISLMNGMPPTTIINGLPSTTIMSALPPTTIMNPTIMNGTPIMTMPQNFPPPTIMPSNIMVPSSFSGPPPAVIRNDTPRISGPANNRIFVDGKAYEVRIF